MRRIDGDERTDLLLNSASHPCEKCGLRESPLTAQLLPQDRCFPSQPIDRVVAHGEQSCCSITLRVPPKTSVARASRPCTHRRDGGATRVLGRTLSKLSSITNLPSVCLPDPVPYKRYAAYIDRLHATPHYLQLTFLDAMGRWLPRCVLAFPNGSIGSGGRWRRMDTAATIGHGLTVSWTVSDVARARLFGVASKARAISHRQDDR